MSQGRCWVNPEQGLGPHHAVAKTMELGHSLGAKNGAKGVKMTQFEAQNLVLFITDNHARAVLGAMGHPTVHTPNLDRIAASGATFTNAYCASPLCCPSRAAIATGRYPHQTGYWDNALAYDGAVPTWHHRIRDQGHTAVSVGKLHYRSGDADNGFSEEILPLHILDGKGAVIALLRATPRGMPQRSGHGKIYDKSGVGTADYQSYDQDITDAAIKWLEQHGKTQGKPWVLMVSYASPHPPFTVPQDIWDRYPLDQVPMPVQWRKADQPDHPALRYLNWMNMFQADFDEDLIRRVVAGYCGLITVTDAQIGKVMAAIEALDLMRTTRIIYTSDHGEAAGHHGIMGKANHYEHSIGVPLLMMGQGIAPGTRVEDVVSLVDLFPTVVDGIGAQMTGADADLPGRSLWPLSMGDTAAPRPAFTEFHAMGSVNASFALRKSNFKLIYHVDMPSQLFDVVNDPAEETDLLAKGQTHPALPDLLAELRAIVDPEQVDARAKSDQRRRIQELGGIDAVANAGVFSASPIPGKAVEIEETHKPAP